MTSYVNFSNEEVPFIQFLQQACCDIHMCIYSSCQLEQKKTLSDFCYTYLKVIWI